MLTFSTGGHKIPTNPLISLVLPQDGRWPPGAAGSTASGEGGTPRPTSRDFLFPHPYPLLEAFPGSVSGGAQQHHLLRFPSHLRARAAPGMP